MSSVCIRLGFSAWPKQLFNSFPSFKEPDFPCLADEIAEPRPDMNIKVAAFTVSKKSISIQIFKNSANVFLFCYTPPPPPPPPRKLCGGYTVFTLSVGPSLCPCVCPSVTFCFLNFHHTLQACSYMQNNHFKQKVRARGQFY